MYAIMCLCMQTCVHVCNHVCMHAIMRVCMQSCVYVVHVQLPVYVLHDFRHVVSVGLCIRLHVNVLIKENLININFNDCVLNYCGIDVM